MIVKITTLTPKRKVRVLTNLRSNFSFPGIRSKNNNVYFLIKRISQWLKHKRDPMIYKKK